MCSRQENPRNEARSQCQSKSDPKWYALLGHPKRSQHTKFGIPTSNNIGDMLQTRLYIGQGHSDLKMVCDTSASKDVTYSKFGIPISKI